MRQRQRNGYQRLVGLVAFVALCCVLCGAVAASGSEPRLAPLVESSSIGWIDWEKGEIYGIGRGYLDKNNNSRPKAMAAARVVAAGNIVKQAASLQVDDRRTLQTMWGGSFVMKLRAFLRTRTHSTGLKRDGRRVYYEVVEVASMHGIEGLTAKFLSQLKSSPDINLAPPQRSSQREAPGDDAAPWLVLDATGLAGADAVNPALFPKIVTRSGTVVYDLQQVAENSLLHRGMAEYVVGEARDLQSRSLLPILTEYFFAGLDKLWGIAPAYAEERKKRRRRGRYIVKSVKQSAGLAKTNLVISEQDAKELKVEDTSSQILKNCRVIVIVSSSFGGVESSLPRWPSLASLR